MTSSLSVELRRFLIVGSTTVAIDFLCYTGLMLANVSVPLAKAVGFACGMIFAWFANRVYTFGSSGGGSQFLRFVVLYLTTLALNVLVNQLGLSVLGLSSGAVVISFLLATGLSAATNFAGMKLLIFRPTR